MKQYPRNFNIQSIEDKWLFIRILVCSYESYTYILKIEEKHVSICQISSTCSSCDRSGKNVLQ